MIGVYKITNLINGHCYIGQSIDIMRRWKTHINGAVRAKWLDSHTEYTSKNKVSKIKAVCDGERKSAFGFKYNYL